MADPISISSGLLTLVVFGLKASTSLYQTIKGYNSHQRNVRELREELEALTLVLTSLNDAAAEAEADFAALKLPLLRCGNACKDFEAIIVKCAEHSGGSRTSFRDWARLRYMGDDVAGFRNMLAGYKSTITIALCSVNLRSSAVTTSVLNEYQEKIEDTMSDLTEHLRRVDEQLQTLLARKVSSESEEEEDQNNLESEQESIIQCINICTDVAVYIDSVRPKLASSTSTHGDRRIVTTANGIGVSAQRDTEHVLGRCKDDLAGMYSQLNDQLAEVSRRQQALSQHRKALGLLDAEQEQLKEEIESINQSLAICAEASQKAHPDRTNIFEDVSMADDGHQVMVSTFGDLVCARRITAGARSTQWLGQMSDESLQQLSKGRDRTASNRSS